MIMESGEASNRSASLAEPVMPFPGGGHTLASHTDVVSKEEARFARLAALESRSGKNVSRWPAELKILVDMGYDEGVASLALQECGGNLRAAAERIS
jgi:hypothetical protein